MPTVEKLEYRNRSQPPTSETSLRTKQQRANASDRGNPNLTFVGSKGLAEPHARTRERCVASGYRRGSFQRCGLRCSLGHRGSSLLSFLRLPVQYAHQVHEVIIGCPE